MSKTKHLDNAIEIFSSKKAKRAKPATTFTLSIFDGYAVLQGARGKTVATISGGPSYCEGVARQRMPEGTTLEVVDYRR